MVAYVVHFKKATAFDEIGVLKYDGKTDAEAATFDLDESRSAYVLQSDNDIIKTLNLNSGPMLVKLYNALGGLIGGEQKAIGRFEDLGAARQRVIMRLLDYGKRLEVQSQPKSEELRLAKEREAAKQKATEDYLSATDEPQRKAAMARLKELGVSVPSQTQVEDHNMVAKRKTAKKGGRKPAAKKEKGTPRAAAALTYDLPKNLSPPADAKSGAYIRSLIMLGKGTEDILKLVKQHFKGSTAKGSDVSWNRAYLKDHGKKVPDARKAAE